MTNHNIKLIITEDGSHSLMREDINETYHSSRGARSESLYVFVEKCLEFYTQKYPKTAYSIFEVGFGTGLNALLTAQFVMGKDIIIDFHSLEPIPVTADLYEALNFGESQEEKKILQDLHLAKWQESVKINDSLSLTKYETTLERFKTKGFFDMIYFDAFAPSKQAEVWALENIKKCYSLLQPGGILTTYCAQGQFKRNLKSAGFEVEKLKGALGKMEMVRAHKPV